MATLTMLSPGVYMNEVDKSQYITDSSTCIIGMVGGARFGPVGVPTLITSQQELVKTFGEPVEGEHGLYSAMMALVHASQVIYTRVVRGGTKATAGVLGTDKILYKSAVIGDASNGLKISQTALTGGKFSITVKDAQDVEKEKFENLTLTSSEENYVEAIVNSKSKLIRVELQSTGEITAKDFTLGDTVKGGNTGANAHAGKKGTDKIVLESKYFDSELNGCSAVFSAMDDFTQTFNLHILDENGNVVEQFSTLSLDAKSPRFVETIINNGSIRVNAKMDTDTSVQYHEDTLIFSGGDDGILGITAQDVIGDISGGGLQSFSNPETVTIDVLTASGWSDSSVIKAGLHIV